MLKKNKKNEKMFLISKNTHDLSKKFVILYLEKEKLNNNFIKKLILIKLLSKYHNSFLTSKTYLPFCYENIFKNKIYQNIEKSTKIHSIIKNTNGIFYTYIKNQQINLTLNLNSFIFNFFSLRKKKKLLIQNLQKNKIQKLYLNLLKKNKNISLHTFIGSKKERSYTVLKSVFKRYKGILKVRKRKLRRRLIRKLKNTVKKWQSLQDRIFLRKHAQQIAPRRIQETKRRTVILHHLGTKRNLKLTATTLQGQVLLYFSCGSKQFKKSRRRTGIARLQAMNKMLVNLKKLKIKRVILCYNRGKFPKIRSIRRTLRRKRIRIIKYIFKSTKAHNGCRKKKQKRK